MSKPVFISYSTDDTAITEQIRDGLENAGSLCWMAPRDIAPGQDYGTQIIDAIEGCTVLVLVLSESSNYSIYVRKEVERAIAKGKTVIPFRIQEVTVSRSLEFFISDAQWIDAWGASERTALATLPAAVQEHLQRREEQRRTPPASGRPAERAPDRQPSPTHSPSPTHRPLAAERPLFVGREGQLAELEDALAQTLQGRGQLRFVTGEAGAGKSALLAEFQYRALEGRPDLAVAVGVCDAQTGATDAYLPFREILTALAKQDTGGRILQEYGSDLVDRLVPASALGAGRAGQPETHEGRPVEQSQIFEQVVKVLQALAAHRPLVLALEDLHWADEATIGLFYRLGRQLAGSRILLLATYRTEEVSIGRGGEPHPLQKVVDELRRQLGEIHIDLDAVRAEEGRTLVDALLDTERNRLDAAFRQALYAHTGGQPLFLVELLRDLQSDGGLVQDGDGCWVVGPDLDWSALPARVEGIIAVRMARLEDEERQLLTTASVMGEHFIAEAVAQALHIDSRQVALQLSGSLQKQHKLVQSEGVARLGSRRLTRYRFSHGLMQIYLYEQLDDAERSFLHEDLGTVLEEIYGEQVGDIAVQLAHHFRAAGLDEKAVGYLIRAGETAARTFANTEAMSHFRQALALLDELPAGDARDRQEFTVQVNLGLLYGALYGPIEQAVAALTRALALGRQLGLSQQLGLVLQRLSWHTIWNGEPEVARRYAQEGLVLAEAHHDPELLVQAHAALGGVAYMLGRHGESVAYGERVTAFYRRDRPALTSAEASALDRGIFRTAFSLVAAGYPDQALRYAGEGLTQTQAREDQFWIAIGLFFMAMIHNYRGEWQAALPFAQAGRELSARHEFREMHATGCMAQSRAVAMLGDVDGGIQLLRRATAERNALGTKGPHLVGNLAYLGEACGRVGRVAEGLAYVEEALAEMAHSNDRLDEAQVHRIQGDQLLLQHVPAADRATVQQEAEACFRRAIQIAREGGCKLWEARAMASLCRLLGSQGRGKECRQELAELYAWFTEGFETEDLRVVKAVLDGSQIEQ